MKLKSFTTKQGKNVPLTKIAIFVGPNNTGKSQTLRDIRERLENGQKITFYSEYSFISNVMYTIFNF